MEAEKQHHLHQPSLTEPFTASQDSSPLEQGQVRVLPSSEQPVSQFRNWDMVPHWAGTSPGSTGSVPGAPCGAHPSSSLFIAFRGSDRLSSEASHQHPGQSPVAANFPLGQMAAGRVLQV